MSNRLLIIDDEPELADYIQRVAQSAGFEAEATTHADDFKEQFIKWKPTAIVLDLVMPDVDGIELLRWLIGENCKAPIVILSGFDVRILDAARRVGRERGLNIAAALSKPVRAAELKQRLEALRKSEPQPLGAADLEKALEQKQLFVFYQPKVSLRDGKPVGAEALVRWLHPELGVVSAEQMGPLIESAPHAEAVTEYVMRAALKQQKAWAADGIQLAVSVNMSAASLNDEHVADRVAALCALQDVSPQGVIIEITETAAMSHELEALDILTRLRMKGFQLSIDDFGTAFSSLARLRRIPATELKIDRSFVTDALVSPEAQAMVKTIIGMARDMNLKCVAEGIETPQHYHMLAELGCEIGQGYAIAKPLAGEKLVEWHTGWTPPGREQAPVTKRDKKSTGSQAGTF